MKNYTELQQLCSALRYDIITSTTQAGSGHPTSSMSAVELMAPLWFSGFLHIDFTQPKAISNDRIIFSKGHACPLLYSLYHRAGVISQSELLSLRKFGSKIEGHPTPEFEHIDVATGSLGQGLSVGLGMALAIKQHVQTKQLNLPREPKIFVLMGDSEMAEGQVWEAMELAAYYKVNNLIGIIDVNRLGQRGGTMLEWDLDTYKKRAEAFGWEAVVVEDGHNLEQIYHAWEIATNSTGKPVMIIAKTQKGFGISAIANQDNWHGKSVPTEKMSEFLTELGDVDEMLKGNVAKPEQTITLPKVHRTVVDPTLNIESNQLVATREAYGQALVQIGEQMPQLVVLDAETSNSTFADKFKKSFPNRFYEMFIAEQNMVSVAVGMSKLGFIPFVSTFSAFFARAFDQIRMAQYSEANVKIVGSHAGVSIGADGSSQMGLEDIAIMRSVLDSIVLYPSDAVSTDKLTQLAAEHQGVAYLRLTREKTPILYSTETEFKVGGSQIVRQSETDQVLVIAAGITVHEALKAHQILAKAGVGITVMDAYSVKPIDRSTLLSLTQKIDKVIVVEDHYPAGGLGETVMVALSGTHVRVEHLCVKAIPHSGSPEELLNWANIDTQSIVNATKKLIG